MRGQEAEIFLRDKTQRRSLGQRAVLTSPREIFKLTIHRDPLLMGLGWILGTYIFKSLADNSRYLHFSKGGMLNYPEFHVDNILLKDNILSLEPVFCCFYGLFVCIVDQETILSYNSLDLLKPFISLESNQDFCPGKVLLLFHLFIKQIISLARYFFKDMVVMKAH